jgi:hypothetical protein
MRRELPALLAAFACGAAIAQTPVPDGPRPPSLPEAAFEKIDQSLRERVANADSAEAHFVRGLQATMDPGARVAGYAEAWRQQPSNLLFLSSFADACMVRAIPAWPECASADPISRWASRDADNAVPRVLLAERARQRGDLPGMREQLAYAAELKRFDSYRPRGAQAVWRLIAGIPAIAAEPEAPFAATTIGALRSDVATVEFATVCRPDAAGVVPEVGEHCRRLARTMADRADTYEARMVGLAIAYSWSGSDDERKRLAAERDRVVAAALECGNAKLAVIEILNRDAASRSLARDIEAGVVSDSAAMSDPASCARVVARAKAAKLI